MVERRNNGLEQRRCKKVPLGKRYVLALMQGKVPLGKGEVRRSHLPDGT
jgi:hypothetical protein